MYTVGRWKGKQINTRSWWIENAYSRRGDVQLGVGNAQKNKKNRHTNTHKHTHTHTYPGLEKVKILKIRDLRQFILG